MRWMPQLLIVAVSAALLAGCNVKINMGSANHKETREHTFEFPVSGGLEVLTSNGSIEVRRRSGIDEIRVKAKISASSDERLDETVVVADPLPNGTLVISVSWPGKRESKEGCSFVIETPDVVSIRAKTGNGSISIENLAGPADLETSNGAITVKDHDGPVEARTSNGRVELEDVGGLIVARTSNGRVEVDDARSAVDVASSNGRISISLDSDNAGPVKAQTSNGRIKVKVGPRFGGEVVMRTSNSKIKYEDFPSARVLERTKTTAHISIGGADHISELTSSNGSITIERD